MILIIMCKYHANCCKKRGFYLPLKKKKKEKRKKISQEIADKIIKFHCSNENSRGMPWKKGFVSIARRSHMQKH